jgi:hypothetical protein
MMALPLSKKIDLLPASGGSEFMVLPAIRFPSIGRTSDRT